MYPVDDPHNWLRRLQTLQARSTKFLKANVMMYRLFLDLSCLVLFVCLFVCLFLLRIRFVSFRFGSLFSSV
jgi:hypothetical protein